MQEGLSLTMNTRLEHRVVPFSLLLYHSVWCLIAWICAYVFTCFGVIDCWIFVLLCLIVDIRPTVAAMRWLSMLFFKLDSYLRVHWSVCVLERALSSPLYRFVSHLHVYWLYLPHFRPHTIDRRPRQPLCSFVIIDLGPFIPEVNTLYWAM